MLLKVCAILYMFVLPAIATLLPKKELSFSKCIQNVGEKHFLGTSVTVVLPKISDELTNSILKGLNGVYSLTMVNKHAQKYIVSLNKPRNIIFFISNRSNLSQAINYLKIVRMWNRLARFLLILNKDLVLRKMTSQLMSEVGKIFQIFMNEDAMKAYLIVFDGHKKLQMFSWFTYDEENNCSRRVQTVRSMGECFSDFDEDSGNSIIKTEFSDLPIIPLNLDGCPLVINALKMEPYTICNDEQICCNGIEIRLLQTVANSLNLKMEVEVVEKVVDFVYNNSNHRTSNLLIGGINQLTASKLRDLKQTVTYYQDELTWCFPVAATIHPWLNVFAIASGETWGYFFALVFIAGTAMYYFHKFYHHHENYWYCIAAGFFITASTPSSLNPEKPLFRAFFAIFLIYGFYMTATFNAFHITVITHSHKFAQITPKAELVDNSAEIFAENELMSLYKHKDDEVSKYLLKNFRSCVDINSCLEKFLISSSNNSAVASTKVHARNYPLLKESPPYCFERPENIYSFPVSALAHEHFHLMDEINQKIQNALEGGLIVKWELDSKLIKNTALGVVEFTPFTFRHVAVGILVLIGGTVLAILSFVIEIYLHSKLKFSEDPSFLRLWEGTFYTQGRDGFQEWIRYFRYLKTKALALRK